MPNLVVLKAPDGRAPGEKISLPAHSTTIGRDPAESQLVLPQGAISRKHARIFVNNETWYVEDLGSRNKTFVNNREIASPTALKNNDDIKICDFLLSFREERKPDPDPVDNGTTTVEASLKRAAASEFLEAQPSDKLRAIINITTALSRTLDLRELLPRIADELFKIFRQADRCFVIEKDEVTGQLIPLVVKTLRPNTADRFSKTIVNRCLDKLEAYLSEDASGDTNISASASIAEFRIRSVMCVPLATQDGKPLGVIQLDSQDRGKKFTQDDLKLLICVAGQASVAMENAAFHQTLLMSRKLEAENDAARDVQAGFLPQTHPDIPGYQFFSHYLSARNVGGDYYDFIEMSNGRYAALLGDVSGKGVPAALLMARVSGEARVCILTRPDVATAVTQLNAQLMQANLLDRYITLMATVIDPATHGISMVNAGHDTSWIYRAATHELVEAFDRDNSGFPVGWVPGYEYMSVEIVLEPGDMVLMCTDGIYDAEASNGDKFGKARLHDLVLAHPRKNGFTPRIIGKLIIDAVLKFAANHPQFDDIALVIYGRSVGDPSGEIEL